MRVQPLKPIAAVVLAAGEGTRMRSSMPKVLHQAAGKSLLAHVLDAVRGAGCGLRVVVVGHGADQVKAALPDGCVPALQARRRGTGHAVLCARPALKNFKGTLLVAGGDSPLLSAQLLKGLARHHAASGAAATVMSAVLPQGGAYGRILRGRAGELERIVEARDASAAELTVREVNSGVYCFEAAALWKALEKVRPSNAQGEYYLTDALALLIGAGQKVAVWACPDADAMRGVNDRAELAWAAKLLRQRKALELMASGVTITDPANTHIDAQVKVGRDTIILPYCFLEGSTVVGQGCQVGPFSRIKDSRLAASCKVEQSVLDGAQVESGASVGPWTRLRPGSKVGPGSHLGNFVEVKNSVLASGVKAGHLSYLGDAQVGAGSNIGCGTITANYDGKSKHKTILGAGVFTGSGTVLVAPARMGAHSSTGAGAVVLKGRTVAAGQTVVGVPARPLKRG
jgi:bifunctional UDP-N-acetylglucosamine pyrophosphorylase/glucosamine-1-phosphate N-acetyltransferase